MGTSKSISTWTLFIKHQCFDHDNYLTCIGFASNYDLHSDFGGDHATNYSIDQDGQIYKNCLGDAGNCQSFRGENKVTLILDLMKKQIRMKVEGNSEEIIFDEIVVNESTKYIFA